MFASFSNGVSTRIVLVSALALLSYVASTSAMAIAIYTFDAPCANSFDGTFTGDSVDGCGQPGLNNGAAGLGEGNAVVGTLLIDESLVSSNGVAVLSLGSPLWSIVLDWGNFVFTEDDPSNGSGLTVSFGGNASTLDIVDVGLNSRDPLSDPAFLPSNCTVCFFGAFLGTIPGGILFDGSGNASAIGNWVRSVPEPSALGLLVAGLIGLRLARRKSVP